MSSKAEAKSKIAKLVDELDQIIKRGEHKKLSEDDTRRILIEPLFEALGWNTKDFSQLRSQVESHREEGRGRVDYSFQINGVTKFLLEAKPLKADLDDPEYAKQVIDYAWHKSVTWAVLSDFEGLKIFNAEWKEDDVEKNRYKEFNYKEYLPRFEELWILSKESFEEGLIDKAAEEVGRKIKRRPVGEAIFDDLMSWRVKLLDSIKKLKQIELTDEDIEECVQKILDRLIFIRTCEDRGFEDRLLEGALRKCEQEGREEDLYDEVVKVFQHYYFYDSELFKEGHPCEKLNIFPGTIKDIIRGFYHNYKEKIYYNFKEIPADVLGGIYEQYLGHILKRGKLVGGRPHRKEKGIYYTPRYIVDYIVKNTVGKLLEELPFSEAKNLKILDPACGSGSFLIRAYEEMENYLEKEGHKVDFARKVEVLQNNIYGVDLDQQAVEIAQLNLMMNSLTSKVKIPKLSNNIKRGNSLIDDPKVAGDKAFNWKKEFPEVFTPSVVSPLVRGRGAKEGGFDVVIGNPPYVQISMGSTSDKELGKYLIGRYKSSMGRLNTFGFFIKLGIDLLRENGFLGFIIPNTILTQDYYKELREIILGSCKIRDILSFEGLPFKGAVVENIVLLLQKTSAERNRNDNKIQICQVNEQFEFIKARAITQKMFLESHKNSFNIKLNENNLDLKQKIEAETKPLGEFLFINQAIALKHERAKYLSEKKTNKQYKPVLDGRNINRYSTEWNGIYLKYDINSIHSCKREDVFLSKDKLFFRRVGDRLIATYDNNQFYALNTLVVMNLKNAVKYDAKYFLALFNSKLLNYYYQLFLKSTKKVFSEIQARQVAQLPIKQIDLANSKDRKMHDALVDLADTMLNLNKQYAKVKDRQTTETERLKNKIKETDDEIDRKVYELYGLTKEEIKIVEGARE